MRAIIIEDKDARAILDKLKLESLGVRIHEHIVVGQVSVTQRDIDEVVRQIHRKFHYEVCTWLQEQGANIVR